MDDDQLLARLGAALRDPDVPVPDPESIQALRAAAENQPQAPSRARAAPARARPVERRRSTLGRTAAVAAAAVVLLGAGAFVGYSVADRSRPGGVVEYTGAIGGRGGAVGQLSVVKTGIGRVVDLETDDLPILPTGELYEIWFVAPGDRPDAPNRISAGTFHPAPDGRTDVVLAAAADPEKYPVVEVTSEPGDGDPAPTGPVVLRETIAP